jgi:hypothetical protein
VTASVALLLAIVSTGAGAQPASESSVTTEAAGATEARAATVAEERAQRAAQKKAEAEEIRRTRKAEALQRLAEQRAKRRREHERSGGSRSGTRLTDHGTVQISCTKVVYEYTGFPTTGPTTATEIVHVDGTRLAPVTFTFTGSGTSTVPISVTDSAHRIDALVRWDAPATGDSRTPPGWDMSSQRVCIKETEEERKSYAFTVEKRQRIDGTGGGYVTTPLTGEVGQKVDYEIVATNTGTGILTFGSFTDAVCDPGTIVGPGSSTPVLPGSFVTFRCTHVITAADQLASPLTNVASVTGTPGGDGGEPITHESNKVLVEIPAAKAPEKTNGKEPETPTTTSGGNIGVLASSGSQLPRLEAIGEVTSAPSLSGRPEGCVRSSFVVSVKAKNVKSVTFYLDGHRLKTLTAKSARRGRLSVRVQTSKLKPGLHRLKARITMRTTAASAKPVTVTRSLKFARCAAAPVTPRFTG